MQVNSLINKYIEVCELFHVDSFMVLLGVDFEVLFAGNEYLNVIKKCRENVVGKSIFEVTPIPEYNRKKSLPTFSEAIKNKESKSIFVANLYHSDPRSHVFIMSFNPIVSNNNVVAIRIDFTPVSMYFFFQLLLKRNQKIEPNNLPDNDTYLTRKEHQIAFLLCICRDIKEITNIVNLFNQNDIKPKTIYNIINNNLFKKFNVVSKIELIQKLIELGYHKKMPNSILSNQFIDLSYNQICPSEN